MPGHEDEAVDVEVVALAGLFEGVLEGEEVIGEGGGAVVSAEGEEVEMAFGLVAVEHPTSEARGDPVEVARHVGSVMDFRWSEMPHLRHDETVAKMGHPV